MDQLITQITAAANTCTLYPANHPRVSQSNEQVVKALAKVLEERQVESITFLVLGDELVVEQDVLRKGSLSHRLFVDLLKRRGIERMTLAAGLATEEAHAFIGALACGEDLESSAHIILGRVNVAFDQENAQDAPKDLTPDLLEPVRDAFARFRVDHTLPLGPMEQLVWGFIDSLSQTTRSILPLAKLKEHDEYTFIHSVNVSMLVLAQARSFEIKGPMLHAFGMAGLLHDIGKLTVPLTVLTKPGKLEGEEWSLMQGHTIQGAWYLSEMEGAAPLSIAVAYEHHLRYDGEANYPVLKTRRVPNLASRMTSIGDAYDAMSTIRPYQQPLMRSAALEILKKRSESFYDPLLVANFIRLIGHVTGAEAEIPPDRA
jgi:HD-GYP domain-containing protein (c-di-GMP phosphodiesterase class II)